VNDFFESQLCGRDEGTCRKCRLSKKYRQGILASFDNPTDVDFDCPKGKAVEDYPQEVEIDIFSMAKGFTKAIEQEAKAIAKKEPSLSKEESDRRFDICKQCRFLINGKKCSKCGCSMKLKSRLRTGKCPIGKW
jgi:hypothetical protein